MLYYFVLGVCGKYCNQCVCTLYVCLVVCLSVCVSLKHVQISPNFLYTLPVAVTRSFYGGNAMHYVLSGFVDDVVFSHNEANSLESKRTRMFRAVQVAAQEEKSVISDCILLKIDINCWHH